LKECLFFGNIQHMIISTTEIDGEKALIIDKFLLEAAGLGTYNCFLITANPNGTIFIEPATPSKTNKNESHLPHLNGNV